MKFSQFQKYTPTRESNAYIFLCDDDFLVDESIAVWERIFGGDWGFEKLNLKEFEQLEAARLTEWALSPPLFGPRKALLVREAGKTTKKRREWVDQIAGLENSSLKIILQGASRRSVGSLAKSSRSVPVIEIDPFGMGDTVRWLRDRHHLSPEAGRYLVENLGTALRDLHFEMDKLETYVGGERTVEIADIERLTFRTERFGPFELEDAVLAQDYPKSLRVAGSMLDSGFEPLVLLFRLARVWRQVLVGRALSGHAPREIAAAASVPEWKATGFAAASERFDWDRLVRGFLVLAETDKAFKTASPNVAVTVDVLLWKLIG